MDATKSQSKSFQQTKVTMPFLRNGYHKEKHFNCSRHCLDLSNLQQDVDRVTESLADALTTTVNIFTIKKIKLAKANKTWLDTAVKRSIIRPFFAFNRYTRYDTSSNKTQYTKMRNCLCELLRSKKREYFDDPLTRFLNSPEFFFNELNRITGTQKKSCNFKFVDMKTS